jgi:hypothetical protein
MAPNVPTLERGKGQPLFKACAKVEILSPGERTQVRVSVNSIIINGLSNSPKSMHELVAYLSAIPNGVAAFPRLSAILNFRKALGSERPTSTRDNGNSDI